MEEINPRQLYESFCRDFRRYVEEGDYSSVLRVYNQKSMLPGCNVAGLCGLRNKEEYLATILNILHEESDDATILRNAIRSCFNLEPLKQGTN